MNKYFIRTKDNHFIVLLADSYSINNFGELFFTNGRYADGEQVVIISEWLEIAIVEKAVIH